MDIQETRPNEYMRVASWLDWPALPGGINIFGISGFGGVGKSFLLGQVLSSTRPQTKGFLTLAVDGSDPSIVGDFVGIFSHRLTPKSIPFGNPKCDYFPRSRRLITKYDQLKHKIEAELRSTKASDEVIKVAGWLLRGGTILNKTIPKTREFIDFIALKRLGVDQYFDDAIDLLSNLQALISSARLPGLVKDFIGVTYSERIKSDLYGLAAEEWVADLCAILNTYRKVDLYRLTHAPVPELSRLLLIIDDFEILGKSISHFILATLIPELTRNSNFHTTVLIIGRDDLNDAHVMFQHHLSHMVKDKIRLEPFPTEISRRMFLDSGYSDNDLPQLIKESMGYPFLVKLLCEAKGGSVSFYQQFYDRTTRWMGPIERKWVLPLCYLDRITHESISRILPGVSPSAVLDWFKHEASLRDPNAEWYVVAPYIRRTLTEYHRKEIGPKKSEELIATGKAASF